MATITKRILFPELDETLEEAALREGYYQEKARRLIQFVPKVYSVIRNTLIMEYIPGDTLRQVLPNLEKRIIDEIKRKVLDMVEILNANHVYHSDLNLDNIIIDPNFQPWIIDFGVSNYIPLIDENSDKELFLSELRVYR